ncbi:hypothetical protein H5410_019746 [Solanum commersonii]|uniref:Uncharacterized protein n=1 Tax=Solanum commersonii TaxID=4109 RepID=A0A9J5Z6G0_SOLCO|nr:hypothetical protein H5410_019746 [Solanum commersonii]
MEWFKEGERNTKFFHTIVKGRRSRLRVNIIQNEEGEWLEDQEDIAAASMEFYAKQFTRQPANKDYEMLNELPHVVTSDKNEELQRMPMMEEVKSADMGLNRNSVEGPDGMTGAFYQCAWDIIGEDIHNMAEAFFCGAELQS